MAFGLQPHQVLNHTNYECSGLQVPSRAEDSLHRDLLNKIDLEKLTSLQDVRARTQVQAVIYDLIGAANVPLSGAEKSESAARCCTRSSA